MSLPANCIKRPVSVLMFYTGLMLFGVISLALLRQELFPPITYPKLSIITNYENAAPEEIENLITKPIEEAVGSTAGLKSMTSTSREGLSVVVAEFGWDQNMDFAALGVREKIDLMKSRLPRDAQEPTVIKFNPFELPVITLSVASSKRTPVQLKRFAEKWFKDELEKINGVASCTLSGGEDEEILVAVDQGRLKASGVGINELSKAIAGANLNYPGGTIKESFYEYLIRTMGEFKKIDEIGKVPVAKDKEDEGQGGSSRRRRGEEEKESPQLLLLKDLSEVRRTVEERTSFSRFDGVENVTVSIQKQAHANTIQVANAIKKRLDDMKGQLPKDIKVEMIYDQSLFISSAINGVRDAGMQGAGLAFIIMFIFMRQALVSCLIGILTPISVIAVFTGMYFSNISLNVISLGGIALGIGMLGDNAIVVIENTYRKFKDNPELSYLEQIKTGSDEVMMPVLASSLTSIAVFLPMIFVTGIAGQIFKELAWVVVATHIASITLTFTLLPVLMFGFKVKGETEHHEGKRTFYQQILHVVGIPVDMMIRFFNWLTPLFIKNKARNLMIVLLVFIGSVWLVTKLDRVPMPKVDQGQFMIKVDMPVGTRVEVTNGIAFVLEKYFSTIPTVKSYSTIVGSARGSSTKDVIQRVGPNQAQIIVTLNKERGKVTSDDVVQQVRTDLAQPALHKQLRGARIGYFLYESAFISGGEDTAPVTINLKGSSFTVLRELTEKVQKQLSQTAGVYDIGNSLPESSPETKINVNKDKASYYRLSVTDIATAANIAIRGIIATTFKEEGKEIPVRVALQESDRDQVSKLKFLLLSSPLGVQVPLNELVTFTVGRGPSEIKRVSQERTIQIFAKVYDRSMKEVDDEVKAGLAKIKIPEGYSVELAGASLEMQESLNSLRMALILSMVLVYMIMAAQFESLFQPLIIMFTIPMAIIGVAFGLWVSHTPISVVVMLGVILLGGIVVNNGIVLVDYTNVLINQGMPVEEASITAAAVRLRPVLMTALTTILGLVPLAFAADEGSKLQAPMAIAVMGGMGVSTFLTIVVVPTLYTILYNAKSKLFRKKSVKPVAT